MAKIPVSVIVVTKNEEARIGACLAALQDFDDLWVVDSGSDDRTQELAQQAGAQIVNFVWNGQYPKKRQWCLDTLALKYDWVFFVDADEIVTPALVQEIAALGFQRSGYFVKGRYVFDGRPLNYGLYNNKLALIDRRKMVFPVVDDLDLPGMGEIEGHYQPILRSEYKGEKIGQLKKFILHNTFQEGEAWGKSEDGVSSWELRHQRYAAWERGMNERGAWPEDPRLIKRIFKVLPLQGLIAFLYSYIIKLGFLDGTAGFRFAQTRYRYYRMI